MTLMAFLTVEQSIRKNGDRHLERAIAYASAGYPERYYQGSIEKALRNYKRADEFKIDPMLQPMVYRFQELMSRHILKDIV